MTGNVRQQKYLNKICLVYWVDTGSVLVISAVLLSISKVVIEFVFAFNIFKFAMSVFSLKIS